jgi:hypothetical protein
MKIPILVCSIALVCVLAIYSLRLKPAEQASQLISLGDSEAPVSMARVETRLPPSDLEEYLLGLIESGMLDAQRAQDVLLARESFLGKMDVIPLDFEGWGASTIQGDIYTTVDSLPAVLDWLESKTSAAAWASSRG